MRASRAPRRVSRRGSARHTKHPFKNNRNFADASVRLGDTQGLLPYSVPIGADGRMVKQKLGPFAPGEAEHWARSD